MKTLYLFFKEFIELLNEEDEDEEETYYYYDSTFD